MNKSLQIKQIKERLLASQGSQCPLCEIDMDTIEPKNRCLDHDHDTGLVRAVVCRNCNSMEGKITNCIRRAKRKLTKEAWFYNLIDHWALSTTIMHPTHKTPDQKGSLETNVQNEKEIGIADQLDLEQKMIDSGIAKFNSEVLKAEQSGRGDETSYAKRLMSNLIAPLARDIKVYTNHTGPGNDIKTRKLLKQIPSEQAAYFILRSIFKHFIQGKSISALCSESGRYVEDELKFKLFHDKYGNYYKSILQDFARKGTKHYQHIHRVLTRKANEKNLGWKEWTPKQRISVGLALLKIVLDTTDLVHKHTAQVSKRKKIVTLIPTKIAMDWIQEYNSTVSLLKPNVLPCVIEPDDWTGLYQGGFYSPQLRSSYPLIKTRSSIHRKMLTKDHLVNLCTAVNHVQKTPWKVNTHSLRSTKESMG